MLWKIIIVFLCAMVLVGMIGKLIFPGATTRRQRNAQGNCPNCGRPMIGRGPCACGKGKA